MKVDMHFFQELLKFPAALDQPIKRLGVTMEVYRTAGGNLDHVTLCSNINNKINKNIINILEYIDAM